MPDPLLPLRFLLLVFAGLVNREQARVVEYLREENRVLREQLGKRRLRLTDPQRARLAAKAKALGRSALAAMTTIVTPDTLLRWHRLAPAQLRRAVAAESNAPVPPVGPTGGFTAHSRSFERAMIP